jgi:hypothetical protein
MFLVLCLCLLSVGAFADSVTAQFNLNPSLQMVPSQGSITFTLNPDGSIAASVTVTNGFNIIGIGFNSLTPDLPESMFSPTQPDNMAGWGDAFGTQPSGFLCTACGPTETWQIDGGPYSSVFDVLNGDGQSTVDFFLLDSAGNQWGGNPAQPTTPEPASLLLLGTGVLGVLGSIRRKLL